jgi:hypothetical protein
MTLNDFSNVTTSGDGPALSAVGFGTLLVAAYHNETLPRTMVVTALTELVDAGHATDSAAYLGVQRAFQQNPRPVSVKLGRLANAPAMTFRLTPANLNSTLFAFQVKIEGEDALDISITSDSASSVDEICDALETAIDAGALTGLTTTPSGGTATYLDLIATAGLFLSLNGWDSAVLSVEDRTPDPGIEADLLAIRSADADWYGLGIPYTGDAILKEAADWAETERVLSVVNISDSKAYDNGDTTDLQSTLAALEYTRTNIMFSLSDTASMAGIGALAERFVFDPSAPPAAGGTFHAKTITGVAADALTPTQKSVLQTKGYTVYVSTAGTSHTLGGAAAGGEFLDYTRFNDWYNTRLQEKIATAILQNDRIPYDERGLAVIRSVCEAQLAEGLRSGGVSPRDADGVEPSVTVPLLSQTTLANRQARVLPNVRTAYKYAGAIHKVDPVIINVSL